MTRREVIELILKMKGGKAARRDVKGVRTEFKDLRGILGGLKTGLAGIGVGVLVKQLFDAGVEVQRLNRSMAAITGSSQKAAQELAWLRQTTNDLGQEFYTVADSYKGFLAATRETSIAGRAAREIFQATLESATALGMSIADTEGSLRAFTQMVSKGTVQAEELRGQLGERLYGAFNLAAKAMGKNTRQLNKMLEQGQVAADVLLPRLARIMHEKYGQAALDASNDAQQGVNRFSTAWKDLKASVADAGFLEEATKGLSRLTATLKDPAAHKAARLFGKIFSGTIDFFTKPLSAIPNADDLARLRKIESLQRQISQTQEKINQTEKDMESWRAKLVGKDVYAKQLQRYKDRLKVLNDQLQTQQLAVSDPDKLAAAAARTTKSGPSELFTSEPIGESKSKKAASEAAQLESRIKRLNAWTDTQVAKLESLWDQGLVSLQDYFNQRYNLISKQYQEELENLKKLAAAEEDPDKKLAIQTEIYERQKKHEQDLIDLAKQRTQAYEELAAKQQEIDDLIAAAQERAQDAEYGAGRSPYNLMGDMEDENQRYGADIADMESRHEEELEALEELYEGRMELDEEYAQYKRDLDSLTAAHAKEKEAEKLAHEKKVAKLRVKLASQTAGMLAETMHNLYVATGENNKQLLALYQAAAAAEVAISTAAAIMKAYEESGPYMGTVWAVYLTALGAAQIASIYAQKLAYGGPVGGHSPNDRADNVPIMATADEYMIQRPSARYYGRRIMDAINNAMIPRGVMENILTGANVPAFEPAYALAAGGPVPAAASGSTVIGDVHMTVQARDAQSFADNPEMVADTFKKAVRLGMLRGILS